MCIWAAGEWVFRLSLRPVIPQVTLYNSWQRTHRHSIGSHSTLAHPSHRLTYIPSGEAAGAALPLLLIKPGCFPREVGGRQLGHGQPCRTEVKAKEVEAATFLEACRNDSWRGGLNATASLSPFSRAASHVARWSPSEGAKRFTGKRRRSP